MSRFRVFWHCLWATLRLQTDHQMAVTDDDTYFCSCGYGFD